MKFTMSNRIYDIAKWIALILIPAVGTLYFALSKIWGDSIFPYPAEIVGTLTAVDAFLGAILQISTDQYNKDNKVESAE